MYGLNKRAAVFSPINRPEDYQLISRSPYHPMFVLVAILMQKAIPWNDDPTDAHFVVFP